MKELIRVSEEDYFRSEFYCVRKDDGANLDVYVVPGFFGENWNIPHGVNQVSRSELDDNPWVKQLVIHAEQNRYNLYLYNWPSKPVRETLIGGLNRSIWGVLTSSNAFKFGLYSPLSVASSPFLVTNKVSLLAIPPIIHTLRKMWKLAVSNADEHATHLACHLMITKRKSFVIGHSLGGRMALKVAARLADFGSDQTGIIALAPAVTSNEINKESLKKSIIKPEVYYSRSDWVLKFLYKVGQLTLEDPVGLVGNLGDSFAKEVDFTNSRYRKNRGHVSYEADVLHIVMGSELFRRFLDEHIVK